MLVRLLIVIIIDTTNMIPLARGMRDFPMSIPRAFLVRTVVVTPREKFVEITTLMSSAHPVDPGHIERLKGSVASAHDALSDIVQAVVTMQTDIVRSHILHGFRPVRESQEVETMELMEHGDSVHCMGIWVVWCWERFWQVCCVLVRYFHDAISWRG